MDRTSRIAVFACVLVLIVMELTLEKMYPTLPPKPKPAPVAVANPVAPATATPVVEAAPAPNAAPLPPEEISVLENTAIRVSLTNRGAAIKTVELLQHPGDIEGHIVLNQAARSNVLDLSGWPGADGFKVKQSSPDGIVYTATLPNGVTWERSYTFDDHKEADLGMSGFIRVMFHKLAVALGQPETVPLVYSLNMDDTLTNTGSADLTLPAFTLALGRAEPLHVHRHYQPISDQYLGSGWYTGKFYLVTVNSFNPGFVPLVGIKTSQEKDSFSSITMDPAPLKWLSVENQFYAVLLTPGADHLIQHATFQCFNQRDANGRVLSVGDETARDAEGFLRPGLEPDIEACANFAPVTLPAGKPVTFHYGLYAGPKEFNRLDALGQDQGELMNYGMFALLIVPMLTVLKFWYLMFKNYGVAIILLTLIIKAITWPLQSIANHSAKKMQALAPEVKKLKARLEEKYKDEPDKLQKELPAATWKLYGEFGASPVGGCLPALIQMPVFFSLYYLLQNAVELRGAHFLWVHDLTQPDTVYSIMLPFTLPILGMSHLPINPLPVMVTGLMMVMMRMTPQLGDPQQAKIAQWMPLVFLFIFYNFAAGLSLYYVINNCVSIVQIYRNLRKPLPVLTRRKKK